jgi:hypothetical protein
VPSSGYCSCDMNLRQLKNDLTIIYSQQKYAPNDVKRHNPDVLDSYSKRLDLDQALDTLELMIEMWSRYHFDEGISENRTCPLTSHYLSLSH